MSYTFDEFDVQLLSLIRAMALPQRAIRELQDQYTRLCEMIQQLVLTNMRSEMGPMFMDNIQFEPSILTNAPEVIQTTYAKERVDISGVMKLNTLHNPAKDQDGKLYMHDSSGRVVFVSRTRMDKLNSAFEGVPRYMLTTANHTKVVGAQYDAPSDSVRFPSLTLTHEMFTLRLVPVFVSMCGSYLSLVSNGGVSQFGFPHPSWVPLKLVDKKRDPSGKLFRLIAAPLLEWIHLLPRDSLYRTFAECCCDFPNVCNEEFASFAEFQDLAKAFWTDLRDSLHGKLTMYAPVADPLDFSRSGFHQLDDEQKQRFSERCTEVLENLKDLASTGAMIQSAWDAFASSQ